MYFVFRVYFVLNIDNLASEHLKTARAGPKHVVSNKLHIIRKFHFKVFISRPQSFWCRLSSCWLEVQETQ